MILASSLIISPVGIPRNVQYIQPPIEPSIEFFLENPLIALTVEERDRIFEIGCWYALKSLRHLEQADREAEDIYGYNRRKACRDAIAVCISQCNYATVRTRIVVAAIAVIANWANEANESYWNMVDHMHASKRFAELADQCQDRLTRNE